MTPRRWTPSMIAVLRARYPDEGIAIAKDLGVSKPAVVQAAKRYGVSVRHPHARTGRAAWMRRYPAGNEGGER